MPWNACHSTRVKCYHMHIALVIVVGALLGVVVGESLPLLLVELKVMLMLLIYCNGAYCITLLMFLIQVDGLFIYIIFYCELTPSVGIVAL